MAAHFTRRVCGLLAMAGICSVALLGLTAPAHALSPLRAEVQPLTLRPRTQAPAYLELKLHSQSRTLLEGTLDIQLGLDEGPALHMRIPDLALPYGTTTRRLFLPPPPLRARSFTEARLKFSTRSDLHELGSFPLTGNLTVARQYLIGVCRPESGMADRPSLAWQTVRPERLLTNADASREIVSAPVWFLPDDLPPPLGLCAFDTVVLEGPTLAALRPPQLADLVTWVEGGGSLLVVAPHSLRAEQTAFLNRLGSSAKAPAPFSLNSDGTVTYAAAAGKSPADSFHFRKAGLGRFVVALASPAGEVRMMDPDWIRATHFLAHSDLTKRRTTAANDHRRFEPDAGGSRASPPF